MSIPLPDTTDIPGSERGVSDLVAFTLTFSIIVTSVAFVSVFGLGTLQDAGDSARADSAEASMIGFHDSVERVRTGDISQQTTEFQLNSDTIRQYDSRITVLVDGTPRTTDPDEPVDVGAFARETGQDATIVYESGSVYREERRGEVGVRAPSFRCGPDTAHVALVKLTGDADFASDNAATITAERTDSKTVYPDPTRGENGSADEVTIDVGQTHNPAAWHQVFDTRFQDWNNPSTDRYSCDDISRVYVHVTTLEVRVVR